MILSPLETKLQELERLAKAPVPRPGEHIEQWMVEQWLSTHPTDVLHFIYLVRTALQDERGRAILPERISAIEKKLTKACKARAEAEHGPAPNIDAPRHQLAEWCWELLRAQAQQSPVADRPYHHATDEEAALLDKWLRHDLTQEQCDLMEALFRKVGLVYWDDPMRPKLSPSPEASREGT